MSAETSLNLLEQLAYHNALIYSSLVFDKAILYEFPDLNDFRLVPVADGLMLSD
jgi:hypothetical protein